MEEKNNRPTYLDPEKWAYIVEKIEDVHSKCIKHYVETEKSQDLITNALSTLYMKFRAKVSKDSILNYRIKSRRSILNNFKKECKKAMKLINNETSLEEINTIFDLAYQKITKDFVGASIILENSTDIQDYYLSHETNQNLIKLYDQFEEINSYLDTEKRSHAEWDIRNTFVDDDNYIVEGAPDVVKKLNIKNIETLRDYYEQKVSLLTVLTNVSTPCNEFDDDKEMAQYYTYKGKKSKYCVAQIDIPYFQLIEQISGKTTNNDDVIEKLTALAEKTYMTPYKPFDIQLREAIDTLNRIEKTPNKKRDEQMPNINSEAFEPTNDDMIPNIYLNGNQKAKYRQDLENLKRNLMKIRKNRFLNEMLRLEMTTIIQSLDNEPGLKVEIWDKKYRSKSNGFSASYHETRINDSVGIEIRAQTAEEQNQSVIYNSAHNAVLENKSVELFNIKEPEDEDTQPTVESKYFELINASAYSKEDANKKLLIYLKFLNTVTDSDLNNNKEYDTSRNQLRALVDYARKQIKVKDTIDGKAFYDYMTDLIETSGAKFISIDSANRLNPFEIKAAEQNPIYILEDIFKQRRGVTELVNIIRRTYKEKNLEKEAEKKENLKNILISGDFEALSKYIKSSEDIKQIAFRDPRLIDIDIKFSAKDAENVSNIISTIPNEYYPKIYDDLYKKALDALDDDESPKKQTESENKDNEPEK